MTEDLARSSPEICLLVGAVFALLVGSFVSRSAQKWAGVIAVGALGASLVATLATAASHSGFAWESTWALDTVTLAARIIVPVAAIAIIALGTNAVRSQERQTEFYVLVLLASLGSVMLAGAADLLLLVAAYFLATIPLYALAALDRTPSGAEATMKLYLVGALAGVATLGGISILLGLSGTTLYLELPDALVDTSSVALAVAVLGVLAGLLFKAGAVPLHQWVPDATEGSPTAVAAFITTIPKVGGLLAAYRLLTTIPISELHWPLLVAAVAAMTMTFGNVVALAQTNVKRLLGYSTIAQAGYALMAVTVAGQAELALPGLALFLGAYAVTNVGAFAVVAALPDKNSIDDYTGVARTHPWTSASLVVCLLGLVGTPPLVLFAGKLSVFTAAWDGGYGWLTVVGAVNTAVSLAFYLRWLAAPYRQVAAPRSFEPALHRWPSGAALICAAASVALGLGAGVVVEALQPL